MCGARARSQRESFFPPMAEAVQADGLANLFLLLPWSPSLVIKAKG